MAGLTQLAQGLARRTFSSKGTHCWIFVTTQFRWLWSDLAAAIESRTGLQPLLIVGSLVDERFYRNHAPRKYTGDVVCRPDIYGEIVRKKGRLAAPADAAERIAAWEAKHGVTTLRRMVLSDRHIGRSYNTTGIGHPISRISSHVHPETVTAATLDTLNFIDETWHRFPPGLILAHAPGSMLSNATETVAKNSGVPFRALSNTRFGQNYYWATDSEGNAPWLSELISAEPPASSDDVEFVQRHIRPTGEFRFHYERVRRQLSLTRTGMKISRWAARRMINWVRRNRKSLSGYHSWSELGMHIRSYRHWHYLSGPDRRTAENLPDKKLVFFPLQVEPEPSLFAHAPHFTNQLATIIEASLSLPANAHLVIKEHPIQIGRRSMSFYRAIERLPNVTLANVCEPSHNLIRRSDLVLAVNSSATYEAAALGVPAVLLSPHGLIHEVSHVTHVSSLMEFDRLPQILNSISPNDLHQRRLDGARYFKAVRCHGIDLEGLDLFNRDRAPTDIEIGRVMAGLMLSLDSNSDVEHRCVNS